MFREILVRQKTSTIHELIHHIIHERCLQIVQNKKYLQKWPSVGGKLTNIQTNSHTATSLFSRIRPSDVRGERSAGTSPRIKRQLNNIVTARSGNRW